MVETDRIIDYFKSKFPFNQDGLEEFKNSFITKTFKKGDIILTSRKKDHELRFLDQGCVREFYEKNGLQRNIDFHFNNSFITDFFSFTNNQYTKKNQECLTDTIIRILSKETLDNFLVKYPCGKNFIEQLFNRAIISKEENELHLLMNTPEENYERILTHNPIWIKTLPQHQIASYLGITPQHLSRLKKKSHSKPNENK